MEKPLSFLFPNLGAKVIGALFVIATFWWLYLTFQGLQDTLQNYLYGTLLGIIPLVGGIFGLSLSSRWGKLRSSIGRALLFVSLGLITWSVGTLIFAFYNIILQVEVPYPSLADAAYIISWPLWGVGMINLSKATGAKYGLRHLTGKISLFAIPIIIIVLSYYLLVTVARGGFIFGEEDSLLKLFFDLAYPIGDIVILTLVTLVFGLSYKYFGGMFRVATFVLLLGFILNYISDFAFSYTTTVETFYVANWVDFLFTATMALLAFGVNLLDPGLLSRSEATSFTTEAKAL